MYQEYLKQFLPFWHVRQEAQLINVLRSHKIIDGFLLYISATFLSGVFGDFKRSLENCQKVKNSFTSSSEGDRSDTAGLHQYLCMRNGCVKGWFDYQIKKCDSRSVFSFNMFTIWLTEVINVTYRFLHEGQYRMHSCTLDTAFAFLKSIYLLCYKFWEEWTEYLLDHLNAAFDDLGSLRLYYLCRCFYKKRLVFLWVL